MTPEQGREALMGIINKVSRGGRWYCGVTGNAALARELQCTRRDLELISAIGWNLIAGLYAISDDARAAYATIVENIRRDLSPAGVVAAATLSREHRLPKELRL